ncbi:hypothetical protein [Aeromonas media]|uniref:hypothetical protein n=1 Tax=Aeromonas media TaxID=651 RepID=UPI003850B93E
MLTHQYQETDRFRYVETVLRMSAVLATLDVSNISDIFTSLFFSATNLMYSLPIFELVAATDLSCLVLRQNTTIVGNRTTIGGLHNTHLV